MAKKILLADDSITIQKVVELTFSDGDYEVIATSNGAKAIQKLSEIRPDIILSDIIMPEKNGYEVCEFVKSHPDLRSIPVILLTGTFEPFDPDRAEKAGCDAVVTKPFESQNLIHKVEELIQQSRASAAPEAEPAAGEPFGDAQAGPEFAAMGDDTSAWPLPKDDFTPPPPPLEAVVAEEPPPPPAEPSSPFDDSSARLRNLFGAETPPTAAEFQSHGEDIFAAPPQEADASQMPFAEPPQPPPAPEQFEEPTPQADGDMPFGKIEAPPYSGETRAFPKMTLDEMQSIAVPPPPEPEPPALEEMTPSRDFTIDKVGEAPPPPPPEAPKYAGETRAFPRFSFDDLGALQTPAPAPPTVEQQPLGDFAGIVHEPEPPLEPPVLEQGAFETPEAEPEFTEPAFETPVPELFAEQQPFAEEAKSATPSPFEESPAPPDEAEPWAKSEPEAPAPADAWSSTSFEAPELPPAFEPATPEIEEPAASVASADEGFSEAAAEAPPAAAPAIGRIEPATAPLDGELTDEQVDRIARRVVELMSDKAIRDIAWEVIPDLAEVIVKDRIRQLENEE
jgi:CheY-like chemotaxis protein